MPKEEAPAYLHSLQESAAALAETLGLTYEKLTDRELNKFEVSFKRQFVMPFKEREIVDLYERHKLEILLGAMVAKDQMKAEFDGEMPESGKFGMVRPRAAFFGIGDDWEDAGTWATGSPQNWIHSGTSLLNGTAGNPIRIGENAVHVIIAIGSLHPLPKLESIYFKIDGKDKPVLILGDAFKKSDLKYKELDRTFIWKKDTTVLAKVFASATFGSTVEDYPYLIGASFIKEEALRVHDPADVVKPAYKIISTT